MRVDGWLCRTFAGLACGLFLVVGHADESCRIAFDMGSSGIRAGASNSGVTTHADIDYLAPLLSGRGLDEAVGPTITALKQLPERGKFAAHCARVGGGFSAWRLALQQEDGELAATLARIRSATGVAVLVIPQAVEGAYGHLGARRLLGDRLLTSHVLDIGGGSLQIAGEHNSFGDALGQKIWHRHLCKEIRKSAASPCALQPMTRDELASARALLADRLKGIGSALPKPVTMTAISRPVTRGVAPAVARLLGDESGRNGLKKSSITAAIDRLAQSTSEETVALAGVSEKHAAYLLSDMLLVEGLMRATGGQSLQIAEIDLNNLPGLLADPRAYSWSNNYGCYLERLRSLGVDAYASDPTSCPDAERKQSLAH
jgi:hypothetical protein